MKKIEKVWTEHLKKNPDNLEKQAARKMIAKPYRDFDDAYHRGIESGKYEGWKITWLLDLFDCHIWDLFEDVDEPTNDGHKKIDEKSNDSEVVSPKRYVGKTGMQVFDVIDEFGLDYYEGNALKYLIRYKKKNGLEDLKKCRDYLDYMIAGYME